MSDRPRPHGPMGDGVFTRCRVCLKWWHICKEERAEQAFEADNVEGSAVRQHPDPRPTPVEEE